MSTAFPDLVQNLRAIAEPTRLRILAVLARGEFSVTELTQILGQSQPRVSRHLKLLGDCGLLERFREQHWIYYRVTPADLPGGRFARDLVAMLDADDPIVVSDAARVAAVLDQRTGRDRADHHDGATLTEDEELAAMIVAELGDPSSEALLYFGQSPGGVLGSLSHKARRVVGMNPSRLEVQRSRAVLHSRGLSHCVLQQGELKALPQASASFAVAVIDRMLVDEARPIDALREVARVLDPNGRALLVEDYESLAERAPDQNPLAALRSWIEASGLVCSRLHPVDVGHAHLLLAVATTEHAAA